MHTFTAADNATAPFTILTATDFLNCNTFRLRRGPQIQLFNSPEVSVVGVSSTFGNAATPATTMATQELLDRFFPEYRLVSGRSKD